ncbi:MAG: RnfABCDGE type electron transport complex subunit A [Brevinematales bacterium]|nr:RnfABCDGE type electron transport complex subunit A [Brevinematales bacterium]
MDVNKIFLITMSAVFVNNFIFSRFLGLCPFFGVSKKMSSAIGMGFAVVFVLVMSTAVIYPVNLLLVKWGLEFLQTIVFILVIASFVQLVEVFLKKMAPALYHALGIYLPLITTNCAILGTAFLVLKEKYTFLESLIFALTAGLGFTLALIMMAGVRERLDLAKVPKAFKGLPIAFISAALMSMAMYAFVGFVK